MTTDKLSPGHTCVDRQHLPCDACEQDVSQPVAEYMMFWFWGLFALAFVPLTYESWMAGPDYGLPRGFCRIFAMACLMVTSTCFVRIRRIIRIELLGLGWHKPGEFTGDHSINQIYKDGGAA